MRILKDGEKNTAKLAVFPSNGPLGGYSVGWLTGGDTYCFVWGNYPTREGAIEILKKNYPDNEIVNFEKENQPHHRGYSPKEIT
jgi:hypothetical protein